MRSETFEEEFGHAEPSRISASSDKSYRGFLKTLLPRGFDITLPSRT
jgi:hypothetical protein